MAKQLVTVLLRRYKQARLQSCLRTVCDRYGSQSQEGVGDHDLRWGTFLCPVRSHIIAVPLPLVYKSSAMVPFNIHHHFRSCILTERVLHSLSLADRCHPTFFHPFVVKMLSKSFTASIFLLALTSSVNAQCVVTPPLGSSGNPTAGDVQQPSSSAPCGSIPIAQNLDSSEAVKADTSGNFVVSITNFGTGQEGSRHIQTVSVDASGTGENFVQAEMVANGDEDPGSDGSQQVTGKLPDGIQCSGGTNKNLCLVSFVSDHGYGNCVVVSKPETTVQSSTYGGQTPTSTQNNDQTKATQGPTNGQNGDQTNANQKTDGNNQHKKRMIRRRRL